MIRSIPKSLRWGGLAACGCIVTAVLGGYAVMHRPDARADSRADATHQPKAAAAVRGEPAAEWLTDVRGAVNLAHARRKDLLLEFADPNKQSNVSGSNLSGSNLSGTAEAALETESFRRAAGETFVLVRLAPTSEMSPRELTQLTTLAQRFGVARFPTFVLSDADARPYAKSELRAAEAESYQQEFRRLRAIHGQRDQCFASAAAAKGIARAKLLEQGLAAVAPFADAEYVDIERQIVQLDAQNLAGLKSKYESAVVARDLDAVIQNEIYPLADRGNYRAAIARLDRLIAESKSPRPQLQLLTAFKGQLYYSLGDKNGAARFLDEAIALDPKSESAARARAAKLQLAGLP